MMTKIGRDKPFIAHSCDEGLFIVQSIKEWKFIMNSSGWIKGMMAKSYDTEKMLTKVVDTMRLQLKEWDKDYQVRLLEELLEKDVYYIVVTKGQESFRVTLPKYRIKLLQETSPYALDKHIWNVLKQQGLQIGQSKGNYLQNVYL